MKDLDPRASAPRPVARILLPVVAVAAIMFLVTGIALPVLPLHVHQTLGYGTFVVGLVAGVQFTAALISRFWSGRYADTRGAKHATVVGLVLAAVAGLLYVGSLAALSAPAWSVALLLALGIANPALGLVASGLGVHAVFLVSALAVLCSAAMALRLQRRCDRSVIRSLAPVRAAPGSPHALRALTAESRKHA